MTLSPASLTPAIIQQVRTLARPFVYEGRIYPAFGEGTARPDYTGSLGTAYSTVAEQFKVLPPEDDDWGWHSLHQSICDALEAQLS